MVVLERAVPLILLMLEALLRRLPKTHHKRMEVEESYRTYSAGYNGEKAVDFYLKYLKEEKFSIFKGIRLKVNGVYFQIDTLLITPSFALILEIKTWAGEITFEKNFSQVTQDKDGKINLYSNPLSQVKLQLLQLKDWFRKNDFPDIPLEFFVVMSNSAAKLKSDPNYFEAHQKVIHSIRLVEKVEVIERKHKQIYLDESSLNMLKDKMLSDHTQLRQDVLQMFSISKQDLLFGPQCPFCNHIPVKQDNRKWFCKMCNKLSKNVSHQAIEDYFLLISPQITSKQAQEFLQIYDDKKIYHILTSMNLPTSGKTKGRIYHQPSLIRYSFPYKNSQKG
ncbi:hypothetical protein AM500_14360 [Bacillus sp. FJAT-18017]|uniref:nuclease-related domain-containing protein n=1 Tax=Bacillus sp. FJAT-18017 TaxID=1705566 RepID=UPI0006AEABA7|nr:nuclease-related domain-containing protein [Bacillus sp. FJAT-18017]ALC90839.1 hypothetical protein AM500_14360 [Bacillus sp. FJAT-18017]